MRPDGLNTFPVGHSNFIHVGEIRSRLARLAMTHEMKLRNRNTERTEGIDVERLQVGRRRQTTGEIHSPLATNVIGDDNVFNPSLNVVFESGHNGIINIGIPEHRGQWMKGWCSTYNGLPFTFLKVNGPPWTNKSVATRNSGDTGDTVTLGGLCIRLTNCMEIRTTGGDLSIIAISDSLRIG